MTARAVSRSFALVVALLIALFAFAFAQSAYADPAPDLQAGGSEGLSDELQTQGGMSKPWGPLQYKIDYDKHTVVFTGYSTKDGVKQQPATITIPAEIEGCTDISIQYGAFRQNENLQTVTIQAAVKAIPDVCFYKCTNLEKVTLSNSVESIGKVAFYGCVNLKTVELGNGLAEIGEQAFDGCKALESITLPATLTSMGPEVFAGCSSLKSIEIPASVSELPTNAFSSCTALATVTLNDGLQTIGERAFNNCYSLVTIDIPNSVTAIDKEAFRYAKALTSAKLPSGLVTLGGSAFGYCGKLSDIGQIPATLTNIGKYAFSNTAIEYVALPDTITAIPEGMFYACMKLESIALPDTLKSIGKYAFDSCKSLEYLRVPASVTSINNYAFRKLESAKMVFFENGDRNWTGTAVFGDSGSYQDQGLTVVCNAGSANSKVKAEVESLGATFKIRDDTDSYTVKHGPNGGTGTMADVVLPKGFAYALPLCKFTRANADFKDWGAPNGVDYEPGQAMTWNTTKNMTILAEWDDWGASGSYTITFAPGNHGTGTSYTVAIKKGSPITLPATSPFAAEEGYTFYGWQLPTWYMPTPVSAGSTWVPNGNWTIKASWVGQSTITFDANGGTVSPTTMKTNENSRLDNWPEATRDGYVLNCWSTTDDEAGQVTLGRLYTTNTTLHAIWDKLPEGSGYVVSFDANGGELAAGEETAITDSSGKLASLPTPTREGYDFKGWYRADMTTKVTTSTVFTASAKVYAAWTEKSSGGGGSGGGGSSSEVSVLDKCKGAAAAYGFVDLDFGAWYMNAPGGAFPAPNDDVLYIDYVVYYGLMTGIDSTHFAPGGTVSRAQVAMVLFRLGNPGVGNGADPNTTGLSDVEDGQWYTRAVNWCVANGVVTGHKDENGVPVSFAPYDPVTREQMATMIARFCVDVKGKSYVGENVSFYPDGDAISEWARKGVAYCYANKIMTGKSDTGNFDPAGNALRCEMAKVVAVTAHMFD